MPDSLHFTYTGLSGFAYTLGSTTLLRPYRPANGELGAGLHESSRQTGHPW